MYRCRRRPGSLIIYLAVSLAALPLMPLLIGCSESSPTDIVSSEWAMVSLDLEGHDFRGVDFHSTDTAWLAGSDGAILHTTDAGGTWTPDYSGTSRTLLDIDFADSRCGWAVGEGGTIRRTIDGGRIWQSPLFAPTALTLFGVTAVTPRKAIVVGADGVSYVTLDGGLRWDTLASSSAGAWHDVIAMDTIAVAVGEGGLVSRFSGYDRIVERIAVDTLSRDPLVTDTTYHAIDTLWSSVETIPSPVGADLLAVASDGDGTLWAVGKEGAIIASADAGLSWGQVPGGTSADLTAIAFRGDHGVIVGLGGVKLITDNSGLDWTGIPSDISLDLYCAAIPPSGSYWAFGSFTILRSVGGGQKWERLTSGSVLTATLTGIEFLDDTLGFAVGYNGTILRTTDGGAVWRLLRQGSGYSPTVWLSAVDFVDPLHGWTVGRTGNHPFSLIVIRTSDGGDSWETFTFSALPWAEDVAFVDLLTGYTCGFGAVLKTVDGGESWEVQPVPIPASFASIDFVDPLAGLTVGAGGAVMRTGDGLVWESHAADTLLAALNGLDYVSPDIGYAVGTQGAVWKTTDGGTSWQELASPTRNDLVAVHFSDDTNGAAVGAGGTIITTTDGGLSWCLERSPTTVALLGVYTTGPGAGWIVGEGGTILTRTSPEP